MKSARGFEEDMDQLSMETMIRSVIIEQKQSDNRKSLPELNPVELDEADMAAEAAPAPSKRVKTRSTKARGSLKQRVLGYRPSGKHLLLAALALVVVFRPWLIPGVMFVAFWIVLIAYLTMGHDRFVEKLHTGWVRFDKRHPQKSARVRKTMDAFALRFDAFLDKLPESWAEKLALPDMSAPADGGRSLDEMPDPFDRLKTPEVYRG